MTTIPIYELVKGKPCITLISEKEISVTEDNVILRDGIDVAKFMIEQLHINDKTEEHLYMLAFDSKLKLLGFFEISHGTETCSLCNIPGIFKRALLCNANRILLVHNHPTGDASPSKADVKAWDKVKKAGDLIEIPVLDSVIIGQNQIFSHFANGFL